MSSHQTPAPVQPKGTAWRELRPLLHPHRALIAVIALIVLLTEAFAVIPPLLMARIIDDHLAAGVQDGAASAGFHAHAKAMGALAAGDGRLVGTFHGRSTKRTKVRRDLPGGFQVADSYRLPFSPGGV